MGVLGRSVVFAVFIGAFLGFVGAFGTAGDPLLPRIGYFILVGAGCGLFVAGCVWSTLQVRALEARPLVRQAVIALMMTPITGIGIWALVGYLFLGGPRLRALPEYLFYAFIMSVSMSLLSWFMFRRPATPVTSAAAAPPRFLDRLPVRLRGAEVWAVEAEDHYLRLHTSRGADLILMRLSDAVAELGGLEGARVHRSWWVARDGIADIRRRNGRVSLLLKDGAEAPVSRAYARSLRQAGWL